MSLPDAGVRPHTPRDLQAYGRRYGLDYRVPGLSPRAEAPVVRGVVREFSPRPGMQLVASDVEVLHRYDSRSRANSPLSIIVLLEGRAEVALGDGRPLTLSPGMALSLRLEADQGLAASQPAGQRLRALTLSLDEACLARLGTVAPEPGASRMHAWPLPEPLRQGLEQALAAPLPDMAQRLLLEGLSLQLLAHGGRIDGPASASAPRLAPRERRRLERVRDALRQAPAREHRLEALAELAAMSPASLRRKFRAAFGRSVFDYLRDCRLTLARDYLIQGFSVQQAAHFSGYRHASNFATAFRRHFGYPPSSLPSAS
ncbi:helix-turn-helix transcriptional regulator [Halomonas sp. M4R1S46]|uniref:helix-turn-helix transcriptional regulator n=1 Tax=Halomonas sp. M4R1S46 TaxID=2982692 RepID=UPI0021E37A06|nr:helix-turn-helix transcriptional regulator [Halomonas sp. M4R1S46]UYG06691.1 helix-turn-helix transcriptional regulator [Halomonas sp. M4R1S46]